MRIFPKLYKKILKLISQFCQLFALKMFCLKFLIILIYCILNNSASKQNLDPYMRYTNVKCLTSNATISSFKCFIKSYSRYNSTLNIFVNLTRSIFDIKVRYDFRHKSLSNSQRSIINSTVDICQFLNGTITNPIFKWIIGMVPKLEKLLHTCPYEVCILLESLFSFYNKSVVQQLSQNLTPLMHDKWHFLGYLSSTSLASIFFNQCQ